MERLKARAKAEGAGNYFSAPASSIEFIPSGCVILDLVLGGGWPLGRIANIVGDKSTGKTLLAIEACANFVAKYPKGKIWYRETEAAFNEDYAAALGMPVERIDFGDQAFRTVEDIFKDMQACIKECSGPKAQPGLYIIDSLDALSDKAEMEREIDKASYGATKAAQISELFRRLNQDVSQAHICVLIISQIRDKIGAMFGEKTTRSGGRALDFYASQVIKLAHLKTLVVTARGQKRPTGVRIKAKCVKNKVGLMGRECEFIIRFGFGIESYEAGMEWLISTKQTKELGLSESAARAVMDDSADWDALKLQAESLELDRVVRKVWAEIETSVLPKRKKY